jgi:hypothetical protein
MDVQPMDISRRVWETKYRYAGPGIAEHSIADTWRRVAHALAAAETSDVPGWQRRFFSILQDFKFQRSTVSRTAIGSSTFIAKTL